jgi:hypothetical protein
VLLHNRLLANARPDAVLRYFSNSRAFCLSAKAIVVLIFQGVYFEVCKAAALSEDCRRGDSDPKCTETEPLHTPCNSATNRNGEPLKGGSGKQNPDSSEHFQTLSEHELGAHLVRENGEDSDLAWVNRHCRAIPEHVRKQFIATARTAINPGGPSNEH